MSDEFKRDEDEVEAHRLARGVNDEAQDEAEGENDVEAHQFAKGSPSRGSHAKG